ncbi:MAG TPA: VIT and VWA domain-containing protein [Vicinamibacteria bacterium]|nr:VIT and VWA domain-containing protein [Vicinamibacteria bacterium]
MAFLLPASEVRAQAGLLVPTSTGRPDASVLALREMAIDVGIARGYARVNVRQVFENRTGTAQEGTYRFRLPPSAAVGDFAVWDGLQRIPGVILEKQRARAIYRELTSQRIDPGLLQQGEEEPEAGPAARPSGGAAFSVRVAPIPAWATKRLELLFQQEVPFVLGQGEFRLGLAPPDGEPPVAGALSVRVSLQDDTLRPAPGGWPSNTKEGRQLVYSDSNVRLDRDLVVRLGAREGPPLRLSAFRNPEGTLPDGLALAPWERPSEIPPETDGFFLLEAMPPSAPGGPGARETAAARPPVSLAILFDTSLSHRWSGLEAAYAHLVRVLRSLGPRDRFALVPFDRRPAAGATLAPATPGAIEAALVALRARPLAPGSDVAAALAAAREAAGSAGRLLLLTDGPAVSAKALLDARGPLPLFTALTGEETPEAFRAASTQVLPPGSAEIEEDLFWRRAVGPLEEAPAREAGGGPAPFRVSGGEPGLRDVYAVLAQPLAPGSLSGWVGRYAAPVEGLRWEIDSPLFPAGTASLEAGLPETALEARDLPRRWARARVDHLLLLIETEGERREWVDEVIALSRRYKFVTPYTAFLAAPRSLLRPRRIQPGDPVLRVECDPGTVSAVALLPFGLRLGLVRRPATNLWEGRFLVPEGLLDGRYAVRILLRDASGATVSEAKHFVLDGRAPEIVPEAPRVARPGEAVRVAARTDEDVVVLTARLADGAPVPLRWDGRSKRSVGLLTVPASMAGAQELFFEAVDGAKNRGFARALLEVVP